MEEAMEVCRRCTMFFKTKKLRQIHNIMHHRRKNGTSETATTTTTTTSNHKACPRRIRRASGNTTPFVCDICAKEYKNKTLIRSHMNSHSHTRSYQCAQCNYASKRNTDLKKHVLAHHDPNRPSPDKRTRKRPRKCDKCDDVLENKIAYKLHLKEKHPIDKSIICEKCNRRFKTNFRLKKHAAKYRELCNFLSIQDCH